jgi:acyl-CoA synthetase (AMP-forming)/AMP-acid ligase II
VNLSEIARPPASPVTRDLLGRAETLTEALATLVERFPASGCPTLLARHRNEQRISLGKLWARAKDVQVALIARELPPGGCVVLILPTGPELVAAYFGVLLAGGIPGLVATRSNRVGDPRAYTRPVGSILENAAAYVLYCEDEVAELFRRDDTELVGRTVIVTPGDVSVCTTDLDSAGSTRDSIATIQYSSGSTGTPKGVLLTHRAMLNNIRAVRDGLGLTSEDVSVNWIPLYHDMGLIDAFLLPLLCGCPTVLIPTMDFMREPALWLWAIHRYRGAVSWAPNFAYTLCAKRVPETELEGLDLSSWRVAINAAEPVLAHTLEAFTKRFQGYGFTPEAMTPAWGLAENVTIATAHPIQDLPLVEIIDRQVLAAESRAEPRGGPGLPSVAIGRCLPYCEVEIRNADGAKLSDRQVGEVWLRTNSLFLEYKDDPELSAQVLVDGWLNTGDRGYVADGNLFFVSRDKDLIIIGGEKYAPHDVETAINRVPGVREGCTISFGVMNEERGTEELAAVVETKEENPEALEALSRAIRSDVTRATGLGIRHLKLVPPGGIEKTTSGKLARRATRRRYAEEFGNGS